MLRTGTSDMADRLAARGPSKATIVLRAQAHKTAAEGCRRFGDPAGAARCAAHAVDLYLAVDAFFDPELEYHARHADAMYRDLTGS